MLASVAVVYNCASALMIVMATKYLYSLTPLGAMATSVLTLHQFTALFFALTMYLAGQVQKDRQPPQGKLILGCGLSALSIVFVNLSLRNNPVGVYQLLKVLSTPCACLGEVIILKKTHSTKTYASLVVVTVGIAMCAQGGSADGKTSWSGILYGCLAPIFASGYSIVVKMIQADVNKKQEEKGEKADPVSSLTLLYHMSPYMCFMSTACIPLTDTFDAHMVGYLAPNVQVVLGMTCFLAVGVQHSTVAVVATTSPLTLQILQHAKTVLTVVIGAYLFPNKMSLQRIFGYFITACGVGLYSDAKRETSKAEAEAEAKRDEENPCDRSSEQRN